MVQNWEALKNEFAQIIEQAKDLQQIESIRVDLLGKKGRIAGLMSEMQNIAKEEKKNFGMAVNELKQNTEQLVKSKIAQLKEQEMLKKIEEDTIDITLPASRKKYGTLHPLAIVQQEIEDIFIGMGYGIDNGPEVEYDLYNFEKANIPADHPARDMQDTFYVDVNRLLRTQTTAIQMRVLEKEHDHLPIKVICPGKVYRPDYDATHSPMFSQIEGLVVDKHVTLCDLKGLLDLFAKKLFDENTKTRFRPSYFPFTEPSVEVDVTCAVCHGKGCRICKGTGWIEILGAGVVNPKVLDGCGIDSKQYSGLAFGLGVERIAMIKYGIPDIRILYENDVRFLKSFK